ncbi:hypothetical protein ACPCVL_05460 [Streptomyces koyangensis]|uniref:hypothetical protein n=1 Tax=Streptomyces koyangensis TaxID=188770 RepID=UPI003C30B89E
MWKWCSTEEAPGNGRYELKGSAFTSSFERAAPSLRNAADALMKDDDTGFRCAVPVWEPPRGSPSAGICVRGGAVCQPDRRTF